MSRALTARINVEALKHNILRVKELAPNSSIIAMVKANGYGHGLATVAKAFQSADAFGVACIEEALEIRNCGLQNKIILMEGVFNFQELDLVLSQNLDLVIHCFEQINWLEDFKKGPIRVWVKVDTGMHRLGFLPEEFNDALEKLKKINNIEIFGIMTHFSSSEDINSSRTKEQYLSFYELIKNNNLNVNLSLANSAGILNWPESHANWVRPGLMLYGASPIPSKTAKDLGLIPAMTLETEIIAVRNLKKGSRVGYGGKYICPQDMTVGVVAAGYGDGYPRNIPKDSLVLVNSKKAKIIGNVSMDMLSVDLSNIDSPKVGDRVVLWGDGLPIEEVSSNFGIISYELLTNLGHRVNLKET